MVREHLKRRKDAKEDGVPHLLPHKDDWLGNPRIVSDVLFFMLQLDRPPGCAKPLKGTSRHERGQNQALPKYSTNREVLDVSSRSPEAPAGGGRVGSPWRPWGMAHAMLQSRSARAMSTCVHARHPCAEQELLDDVTRRLDAAESADDRLRFAAARKVVQNIIAHRELNKQLEYLQASGADPPPEIRGGAALPARVAAAQS